VCASPKAHYTLSKKGLVCVTCNGCNFQGFARSERSDEILRGHIKPAAAPGADPAPAPAPVLDPAAEADQIPVPPTPRRRSLLEW
jgi:hypothetical protein